MSRSASIQTRSRRRQSSARSGNSQPAGGRISTIASVARIGTPRIPEQQLGTGGQRRLERLVLALGDDERADLAVDVTFRLAHEVLEIGPIDVADQQQVDQSGILAGGV